MSTRPLPLHTALDQSTALAQLVKRVRESQQRFEDITPCLPPAMRSQVVPGPLDEQGWTLLAANAAVAAKLRHVLPLAEARLQQQGWAPRPIRVKVKGV